MIASCSCKSDYQDAHYGKGQRVFNPCKLTADQAGMRCSVCGRERALETKKPTGKGKENADKEKK